jgi:hypothetical protein
VGKCKFDQGCSKSSLKNRLLLGRKERRVTCHAKAKTYKYLVLMRCCPFQFVVTSTPSASCLSNRHSPLLFIVQLACFPSQKRCPIRVLDIHRASCIVPFHSRSKPQIWLVFSGRVILTLLMCHAPSNESCFPFLTLRWFIPYLQARRQQE